MDKAKEKILISSCLLGQPVRYDGQTKELQNPTLNHWLAEGRLEPVCPEVMGGLPVPRPAAEIGSYADEVLNGRGAVKTAEDEDLSHYFLSGAQIALSLCQKNNIRVAILKENSPSCGSTQVYDGSFCHRLISGAGITTTLLRKNGIRVFSEFDIESAAKYISSLAPG